MLEQNAPRASVAYDGRAPRCIQKPSSIRDFPPSRKCKERGKAALMRGEEGIGAARDGVRAIRRRKAAPKETSGVWLGATGSRDRIVVRALGWRGDGAQFPRSNSNSRSSPRAVKYFPQRRRVSEERPRLCRLKRARRATGTRMTRSLTTTISVILRMRLTTLHRMRVSRDRR